MSKRQLKFSSGFTNNHKFYMSLSAGSFIMLHSALYPVYTDNELGPILMA